MTNIDKEAYAVDEDEGDVRARIIWQSVHYSVFVHLMAVRKVFVFCILCPASGIDYEVLSLITRSWGIGMGWKQVKTFQYKKGLMLDMLKLPLQDSTGVLLVELPGLSLIFPCK